MRYLTPSLIILLLVSMIANGVMWAKYRNQRAIMTVNGVPITKSDMDGYLEQTAGPQFKALMVQRVLIHGEAERNHLSATDAEVEENYNAAKELDWQFATKMHQNPWLADETKKTIRDEIEKKRILVKDIPVSEDEIAEEYKRNSLRYDEPDKAQTELAVLLEQPGQDPTPHLAEIKALMLKHDPDVKPSTIMTSYPNEVGFLGDNNIFTFVRPQGNATMNRQIFDMKPNEVILMKATPELAAQHVHSLLVRMLRIIPGKKANLKDPKVIEKIHYAVAIKRARPLEEVLGKLWDNMKFDSEEPTDRLYIESFLLPKRYADEMQKKK